MSSRARSKTSQGASKARRKVTTDMARAWLSTVVSPMESALSVECERAARASWSFKASQQDFEYLWPVEAMVAAPHLPNLQQYLRFRDRVRLLVVNHDASLDRLREACHVCFDKLISDQEFRALAAKASEPQQGATSDDDHRYFAEYVVNGWRDLPNNYTYASFWKLHGEAFLVLRERPRLSVSFAVLYEAGAAFLRAAEALWKCIRDEQAELADTFGLPPVSA